jgi:hypothetical protein
VVDLTFFWPPMREGARWRLVPAAAIGGAMFLLMMTWKQGRA